MNRTKLKTHLDDWADNRLPKLAKETGEYPVRFDHCFRRISYDYACEGKWDEEVDRPFWLSADLDTLYRAVLALRQMARNPEVATKLNDESLEYRN